ncbi:hypothetical protein [Streptomyces caniferus]
MHEVDQVVRAMGVEEGEQDPQAEDQRGEAAMTRTVFAASSVR